MADIDLNNLQPSDLWSVPFDQLPKEKLLVMVTRLRAERAQYAVEHVAQQAKRRERKQKKEAKLGPLMKRRPLAALKKDAGK